MNPPQTTEEVVMGRVENKAVRLMAQAQLVKSGVVRVMELQEQGWIYVRP